MRKLAPALLLLMASCGQGDRGPNQSLDNGPSRTANAPRSAPAIVIAATGCAATWDGQAVTPAQIGERGYTLVRQAVDAAGGAQNITEDTVPVLTVEAPADLSVACADTILFALQNAGMFAVRLKPAGGQAPVLMDFPLNTDSPPPPVPMVLGLGAGGRITWNDDPLDAAGLAAQLGRIGSTEAPDPMEGGPPPGGLELRVAREATFGQLHELLRTTSRYNLRPFVYLPSAEAGPSGAQVATPSPPPTAPPPVPPPPAPPR